MRHPHYKLVQNFVSAGNGTIELDEFFVMMEKELKRTETEEDLRGAFKVFDRNGDELISINELRHILDDLGEDLSDEEIKDMMSEADIDGDGYVNYEGIFTFVSLLLYKIHSRPNVII